jgi:signal transduction histidine kinase
MVFSNLLSNSIKYAPVGGTILVKSNEVRKGEKVKGNIIKEDSLLVSVFDNGRGIPVDSQSKIFTKFYRSDNAHHEHADGTGLGLYIVKSIIDHVGGEVWFSSKEKEGTTFYFTIPLTTNKAKKQ